jgi:hypothetical protein
MENEMLEARKIYTDVVTLSALDLVVHVYTANIDNLILALKAIKPAVTDAESIEALVA